MELTHLRSFLQVSASGSASRAADILLLTQPAVTQHIRALEGELRVRLFDRTGRGLRLTAAGQTLRPYAQRSLALLEESRQAIGDLEGGTAGSLLLGAGVTTSIFHLPALLRQFRRQYPQVEVVVRTGYSQEIAALVLDRQVDCGLVTSAVRQAELRSAELFREQIILVAPPQQRLAPEPVTPRTLGQVPLILFPRPSGFRDYLDRTLTAAGVSLRAKMESDSVEAIKSFVAVGLGASLLPRTAVAGELKAGTLVQVRMSGLPPLQRSTALTWRPDRYLAAPQRAFLAMLRKRYHVPLA